MDWNPFEEKKTRVLVVDHHGSVAELVSIFLNRERRFLIVGEAFSASEALKLYRRRKPSLVILALDLPKMSGAAIIRKMRKEDPQVRILIYSGTNNPALIRDALAARPHGFVHKSERLDLFKRAVDALLQGFTFFSPYATGLLDQSPMEISVSRQLTPKERTVLQLIAEGVSTKGIAVRIGRSPKTVEYYRKQLLRKLGLKDVASLTRYAVKCGLVQLE